MLPEKARFRIREEGSLRAADLFEVELRAHVGPEDSVANRALSGLPGQKGQPYHPLHLETLRRSRFETLRLRAAEALGFTPPQHETFYGVHAANEQTLGRGSKVAHTLVEQIAEPIRRNPCEVVAVGCRENVESGAGLQVLQ